MSGRYQPAIEWVRATYGVPAKRGARVEYTGDKKAGPQQGTITGARGAHVLIRLDGGKHALPYHPTWELRYLTEAPAPPSKES